MFRPLPRDKCEWDVIDVVRKMRIAHHLVVLKHHMPATDFSSRSATKLLILALERMTPREFWENEDYHHYCDRALRRFRKREDPFAVEMKVIEMWEITSEPERVERDTR